MKYNRFEDLPVWRHAARLAVRVYALCEDDAFLRRGDLVSQLRRATLSISNNIAEGFERGTTRDLIIFLYIARGSAGEVRSMLTITQRMRGFEDARSEISNLISQSESISRQLRAWADSLQNSPIEGQKHLTAASRETWDKRKRAEAFEAHLATVVAAARERRETPIDPDAEAHEPMK